MRLILLPAMLFMLASCSGSDALSDRQPGQLMVCHEGKSIVVSNADMFVHESHGDPLGPCADGG